jgi:hypothetical protein
MATSTKEPVTLDQLHEPKPVSIDLDRHRKDLERRGAERAAKRQILDDCTNPYVAAEHEMKKPVYRWVVKATWLDSKHQFEGEETVSAQDEAEAWSRFCDRLGHWPSRRNCRQLTITRGKKLDADQVAAHIRTGGTDGDEHEGPREIVKLSAKKTAKS